MNEMDSFGLYSGTSISGATLVHICSIPYERTSISGDWGMGEHILLRSYYRHTKLPL